MLLEVVPPIRGARELTLFFEISTWCMEDTREGANMLQKQLECDEIRAKVHRN